MIITISGQAGSGKSATASELARILGYRHYSMGDMRRKMADKRGMSLAEFNRFGETDDSTDREVDEFQSRLGKTEDNFVIDGRMSWHFIPHSFKIYLKADLGVRAKRCLGDERSAESFSKLRDATKSFEEREKSDKARYMKYYGVDPFSEEHYDLVIDTTEIPLQGVIKNILKKLPKQLPDS
jgi:cytidylate kinase